MYVICQSIQPWIQKEQHGQSARIDGFQLTSQQPRWFTEQ